jgi:putative tryptophan/tyrosine transport system substrate-binding protein
MRRREFITGLASAVALPRAARAQQPTLPVIGLLNGQLSAESTNLLAAFRQGLSEAGFVEGRNLAIVYRSAEGNIEQLPALAAELVSLKVAAIAAVGGDRSVLSAKAATATIPIVFTTGGDPVQTGFVASINRPGGNITGATFWGSLIATKQIGLLRDIAPKLVKIGLLLNPANPMTALVAKDVQATVQTVGLKVVVVEANVASDVDTAFAQFVEQRIGALVIGSAVFFNRNRDRLIALAARHAIPAVFNNRDFTTAGGLMSYGADTADSYRQAGIYVGRILKGDKAADLPVLQPTKFELVINLKTAKALGLTIPETLLATADEVIQ